MWAAADESRAEIVDRYRRTWDHSDATIAALAIDAPGHVPWWPRPDVMLFNILVHVLTETNRHAGHADILREQLDGAVGASAGSTALHGRDATFWENHRGRLSGQRRQPIPRRAEQGARTVSGAMPGEELVAICPSFQGRSVCSGMWRGVAFHSGGGLESSVRAGHV